MVKDVENHGMDAGLRRWQQVKAKRMLRETRNNVAKSVKEDPMRGKEIQSVLHSPRIPRGPWEDVEIKEAKTS